jgi:4'-phosphopantetheinyl transferase
MQPLKSHFPDPAEIHVWKVPLLLQEPPPGNLERLLNREEKLRSEKFRFNHLRQRYIRTHGALRVILSGYCGKSPETLRFARSSFGKPFLADPPDSIAFNLSHCEDLALIAVSGGRAVGIDVERVRHLQYLDSILNRFFNAEERQYIRSASGDEQFRAFLTLWTRREAAAKALGLNLQAALTQILIPLFPSPGSIVATGFGGAEAKDNTHATSWCLKDLKLDTNHCGAVCVEGKKCALYARDYK